MCNILEKGNNPCSSCGVCAVVCPTNCIAIIRNEEGFYRPTVDEAKCTNCGLCQKVCYKYLETPEPLSNYFKDKEIYAAWSKNKETVKTSSSGGVGHELISQAINNEYKACGVVFDAENDLCKHQIAESSKDAERFKSSKYLQSFTPEAFQQFKKDEKYMVVGTPCQIYGVRQWIKFKKWEDNFILIDFFCHGTPSYLLWEKYKQYIQEKFALRAFNEVLFRSKEKSSWHSYAMKISDTSKKQYLQTKAFANDLFFRFFLSDTCLNDSCYQCRLRLDHSAADIRLADFWGDKYKDNEDGVSLVAINTESGNCFFQKLEDKLNVEKCSFKDLENSQRARFIKKGEKTELVIGLLKQNDLTLNKIYKKTIKLPLVKSAFKIAINTARRAKKKLILIRN